MELWKVISVFSLIQGVIYQGYVLWNPAENVLYNSQSECGSNNVPPDHANVNGHCGPDYTDVPVQVHEDSCTLLNYQDMMTTLWDALASNWAYRSREYVNEEGSNAPSESLRVAVRSALSTGKKPAPQCKIKTPHLSDTYTVLKQVYLQLLRGVILIAFALICVLGLALANHWVVDAIWRKRCILAGHTLSSPVAAELEPKGMGVASKPVSITRSESESITATEPGDIRATEPSDITATEPVVSDARRSKRARVYGRAEMPDKSMYSERYDCHAGASTGQHRVTEFHVLLMNEQLSVLIPLTIVPIDRFQITMVHTCHHVDPISVSSGRNYIRIKWSEEMLICIGSITMSTVLPTRLYVPEGCKVMLDDMLSSNQSIRTSIVLTDPLQFMAKVIMEESTLLSEGLSRDEIPTFTPTGSRRTESELGSLITRPMRRRLFVPDDS